MARTSTTTRGGSASANTRTPVQAFHNTGLYNLPGRFSYPAPPDFTGSMVVRTFLYGTAFTIMFTVLPRLGVVGNSAIMNVEPIFALVLAWAILGQAVAPSQVAGGLVVVGTVMWLGLRRR